MHIQWVGMSGKPAIVNFLALVDVCSGLLCIRNQAKQQKIVKTWVTFDQPLWIKVVACVLTLYNND